MNPDLLASKFAKHCVDLGREIDRRTRIYRWVVGVESVLIAILIVAVLKLKLGWDW